MQAMETATMERESMMERMAISDVGTPHASDWF
jgi:hypothetical protein